jgi:uncharacterized protein YndB with AHSA1/START domain
MEYGSIEREIHVEATPEVVFEVISSPEHLKEWWPDETDLEPVPGAVGNLVFDAATADPKVVPITVVDVEPPRLFRFRWVHPQGEAATSTNSFLVTFELVPSGGGTLVRMTETGFREQGWEVAKLEAAYVDHAEGWDHHLSRLVRYVERLGSRR